MFRLFLALVVFSNCFISYAEDSTSIESFLQNVINSFNSQDCASYSSNFVSSVRQKKRRESGLYFAANNAKLSLKESHLLFQDEDSAEVAVCYTIDYSDFVSRIFLEKEDGLWKISKEVPVRGTENTDSIIASAAPSNSGSQQSYASNPFINSQSTQTARPQQQTPQNSCPGGKCGGPQAPFSSLKACRDYGFEPIPCRNGSCSSR